ncbi:gamma-glutamyl kinase [Yoonia sp.]|uniref:gamma-glutamyl kinase n=1 Tax=Yoonia sp. TaxID=2212373 RepID=UPI0019E25960|nr:gamma-glutamyl kinase [Yoonia sp.]MBE0414764.1 gamma-glutamyl kinase [Yoonia sp.]
MLVFWQENLVLLAVPKTGTTALAGALAPGASMVLRDPPGLKHMSCRRYNRFLRPLLLQPDGQAPELMAVVRQPVDWLASWYRYRSRDALVGHPNSTRGISFNDFVMEYCKDQPAPFAAVGSQAKFLRVDNDKVGVDYLFRYESWDKITNFLAQRLNRPVAPKQINVSPVMPTTLSPSVAAQLHDKRAAEFAIWQTGQA